MKKDYFFGIGMCCIAGIKSSFGISGKPFKLILSQHESLHLKFVDNHGNFFKPPAGGGAFVRADFLVSPSI